MQATKSFKLDLESRGFMLRAEGVALFVEPRASLTPDDVARIKAEKAALLALCKPPVGKLPHLNEQGDLVISADTDPQFWYWTPDGQTVWQTLVDLDTPAAVIRAYAARSDVPLHTAMGVRDCKGKTVTVDNLELCVECGWYYERPAQTLQEILGF